MILICVGSRAFMFISDVFFANGTIVYIVIFS